MTPTLGNGKICYLEIPAVDIARSSEFYQRVFGWNVRQRRDGSVAFDDGVGEVSGTWVLGRPPLATVGILIYVMVDSVEGTIEKIVANGGEIVQAIGGDAPGDYGAISRSGRECVGSVSAGEMKSRFLASLGMTILEGGI